MSNAKPIDIPEGYTYIRCDRYSPKEFLEKYKDKETEKVCKEYIAEHKKEYYDTDDEIAIHFLYGNRRVNSLSNTLHSRTTKRYLKDNE